MSKSKNKGKKPQQNENKTADELEAILNGDADDADSNVSGPSGAPVSFSEDSYT